VRALKQQLFRVARSQAVYSYFYFYSQILKDGLAVVEQGEKRWKTTPTPLHLHFVRHWFLFFFSQQFL
jgi:hypothetical protein